MQEGVMWVRGVGVSMVWVGRVNVTLCVQVIRGPTVVAGLLCLGLFNHWRVKLPNEDGWGSWSAWDRGDASCGKVYISVNGRFRYLVHHCVCMEMYDWVGELRWYDGGETVPFVMMVTGMDVDEYHLIFR